nr:unnamed protein product [Digitaria exilis]
MADTDPLPLPTVLVKELVEERPACLAAGKAGWYVLVAGPLFHRGFREVHSEPPMLGLLCPSTRFIPGSRRLNAHHGRVLLRWDLARGDAPCSVLVVWIPSPTVGTDRPPLARPRSLPSAATAKDGGTKNLRFEHMPAAVEKKRRR